MSVIIFGLSALELSPSYVRGLSYLLRPGPPPPLGADSAFLALLEAQTCDLSPRQPSPRLGSCRRREGGSRLWRGQVVLVVAAPTRDHRWQ